MGLNNGATLGPFKICSNNRLALLSEVNYFTLLIETTEVTLLSGVSY